MSGTNPTPDPSTDSLMSPRFIIAMTLLAIAAGTIVAVFMKGSVEVQSAIAGTVIGGIIGSLTGFYYGSAKGSEGKDTTIATLASAPLAPPPPPATGA